MCLQTDMISQLKLRMDVPHIEAGDLLNVPLIIEMAGDKVSRFNLTKFRNFT